jgi:hypothetical protein
VPAQTLPGWTRADMDGIVTGSGGWAATLPADEKATYEFCHRTRRGAREGQQERAQWSQAGTRGGVREEIVAVSPTPK